MPLPKKGLGTKGLGIEALINTQIHQLNTSEESKTLEKEIDINLIEPNGEQPRKKFDETALLELADSIREHGIVQPILVRKDGNSHIIIAGERRWRAAKIAGLSKLPVIIKEYEDRQAFEIALVENLQRENLNPIEEAQSYNRLINEFGLNQEQAAKKVGKSRSVVANALRLLKLDERVQTFVTENKLSNGHARTLLALEDKEKQFELAERIIEEGLSVRQTEALVKQEADKTVKKEKIVEPPLYSVEYSKMEEMLKNLLGTKVKLTTGKKRGKIEIDYYSEEDLDRLLALMKKIEQ